MSRLEEIKARCETRKSLKLVCDCHSGNLIRAFQKLLSELDDSNGDIRFLLSKIERLEKENAELKERQRWIPVTERLPTDDKEVLVWCSERNNVYTALLEDYNTWEHFGGVTGKK